MRISKSNISAYFIFALYVLLALVTYYFFIYQTNYFNNGDTSMRIDADALNYFEASRYYDELGLILIVNPNMLGPILIIKALDSNPFLILLLNLSILFLIMKVTFANSAIDPLKFTLLLLLNPLLLPSVLTVNKEIISLASIALLLAYLNNRKVMYLLFAILIAFFARWQLILLIMLVAVLLNLRRIKLMSIPNRGIVLLSLFVLNMLIPVFLSNIVNIYDANTKETQEAALGGVMNKLNNMQNSFLFFLAVIPKILFNLFGNLLKPISLITNFSKYDFKDLYNNVFLLGHQYMNFILLIYVFMKKKISISQDEVLVFLMYCILYSMGPLIQYRYFFPLYIIICYLLSKPKKKCIMTLKRVPEH